MREVLNANIEKETNNGFKEIAGFKVDLSVLKGKNRKEEDEKWVKEIEEKLEDIREDWIQYPTLRPGYEEWVNAQKEELERRKRLCLTAKGYERVEETRKRMEEKNINFFKRLEEDKNDGNRIAHLQSPTNDDLFYDLISVSGFENKIPVPIFLDSIKETLQEDGLKIYKVPGANVSNEGIILIPEEEKEITAKLDKWNNEFFEMLQKEEGLAIRRAFHHFEEWADLYEADKETGQKYSLIEKFKKSSRKTLRDYLKEKGFNIKPMEVVEKSNQFENLGPKINDFGGNTYELLNEEGKVTEIIFTDNKGLEIKKESAKE